MSIPGFFPGSWGAGGVSFRATANDSGEILIASAPSTTNYVIYQPWVDDDDDLTNAVLVPYTGPGQVIAGLILGTEYRFGFLDWAGTAVMPRLDFETLAALFHLLPGTQWGRMYQERTGASATTLAGEDDPVGTYHDLLTGIYAVAPSDAARPTHTIIDGTSRLLFSGAQQLITDELDWDGTDELWNTYAVIKANDPGTVNMLTEYGPNSNTSTPGAFSVFAPGATDVQYLVRSRGDPGNRDVSTANTDYAAPAPAVITHTTDLGAPFIRMRVNQTAEGESTLTFSGGTFQNRQLYIGARAGLEFPFSGQIATMIIRNALPVNDTQRDEVEVFAASRLGGFL